MVEFPWKKAVWQGLLCKSPSGLVNSATSPLREEAFCGRLRRPKKGSPPCGELAARSKA